MKVLIVHNRYRTAAPSGEDAAVQNEHRMLERNGVQVVSFDKCNDDLDDSTLAAKIALAGNTVWSQRSREELGEVVRRERPDIVHVHNTFAVLSPSVYGAAKSGGAAVVQTLHNYRFFCPSALFLRNGEPCEDCVEKSLWQSIRYRCYRGSLAQTSTLAATLSFHRLIGTYSRHIDRYIALTEFARSRIIRGGIDESKIRVKPNFLPTPPESGTGSGGYVIFVGRLLEGKGVETLLKAWKSLPDVKLKIVGDGALRSTLEGIKSNLNLNVEFVGRLDPSAVLDALKGAELMIVPSEWYEGFPMVIAESFACGTPVLASRIGSLDELVVDGVTGYKFPARAPEQLAKTVQFALADRAGLVRMRINARAFFDSHLAEARNFSLLSNIYRDALQNRNEAA